MNTIKINGLAGGYPETIDGTFEWYYSQKGADDFLDLYEAEELIKDGAKTVDDIKEMTEASTGCGGCEDEIQEILDELLK